MGADSDSYKLKEFLDTKIAKRKKQDHPTHNPRLDHDLQLRTRKKLVITDRRHEWTLKVTNTEDFVGISKGDNETSAQGQGVITTKDDSEKANYTFLAVGKASEEGKPVFLGSAEWSTLWW